MKIMFKKMKVHGRACQHCDTHVFRDRRFCSQLCLIFNFLSFPLKKSYNNFGPQVFEIIVCTIVLFL